MDRDDVTTDGEGASSEAAAGAPGDGTRLSIPMRSRDAFYARVTERLTRELPVDLHGFTARPMFNIMKVAYDNERVHYEVGLDVTNRWLEIALHFEDGPASTIAYLALLDRQIVELKHALGPEVELERWTPSWGRLYELWPLAGVDLPLADRVAARLGLYVATLQPIVAASGIPPERSTQPRRKSRWG